MKLSHRIGVAAGAAAALLLSGEVSAQDRAVDVFVQIFNIGGAGTTFGTQDGDDGSVGCGGGDADALSAAIDTAQGISGTTMESNLPRAQQRDLFRFCDSLTKSSIKGWASSATVVSIEEAKAQMAGLAPDELFMQTDQAANLASLQVTNVTTRIRAIRLARRGLPELGGYAFERGNDPPSPFEEARGLREPKPGNGEQNFARALQRGFSAGDGLFGMEGLAGFINGRYMRIDADDSSFETGSNANGGGVTLGIDKQLGENAFLGLAFGYSRLHTDFNGDFGESDLDDYTFSLYGSIFPIENLYIDGIVSGSILRFDQTRTIPAGVGPAFSDLESEPDGWNLTGDIGIGGEFNLKPVDLNPYLRVAVSHTGIDSFTESGSTLALSLDDQKNTSVTTTVGTSVSLPISTGFGVVSPYARGEYVHEYKDQADDIRGNLALIPQASFRLEPNDTDRNYGHVGGGVTLGLGGGISAFADYDVVLGFANLVVHQLTLGGRLEF